LDVTPCADGRLAHVIRYVLRLPQSAVRRKSYAGATFDVEDSIQKWTKVEMLRHREAKPNSADEPTHYLKVVAYHFSSVDPLHQGCAAHGSDTNVAAKAGLQRLESFREAIESSFCCGASIDLLLMGVDTDTDALRIHVPDQNGNIDLDRSIDTLSLYEETAGANASQAIDAINAVITECNETVQSGMQQL
jgi:carboxysome shell carbonic anhydrase